MTARADDGGRAREAPKELAELVRARALALGFDAVGIARADVPLDAEHERFLTFLERKMHGTMDYLAAAPEARQRLDGDAVLPGAKSVICVGRSYARAEEASDPPTARAIARYARGQDYHNFLRKKLRRLAAFVRTLGPGVRARPLCDVEPVLERAWAARSGLGFVGKNGLVITPGQGSFQLLGEVVTTLELTPGLPLAERCGACTRCLDACPTQAFDAPFVLDPRRCVAYLTIEHRGPTPEAQIEGMTGHLFGCDVCQDVCPFNRAASREGGDPRPFAPLARWSSTDAEAFVGADDAAWRALSEGTPLHRAGRAGMARNALLLAAAIPERRERAISAGLAHDDPSIRELARRLAARAGVAPPEGEPVAGSTEELSPRARPRS